MRRRRFGRRKRRFVTTRAVTAPGRFMAANFSTVISQLVAGGVGTTVMLELAKHQDHVGDQATTQGRVISQLVRKFEIGGIVFNAQVNAREFIDEPASPVRYTAHIVLCTIDLDSGGNPVIVPDFSLNEPPVTTVGGSSIGNENVDFPTRIHWRHSYSNAFPTTVPSQSNNETGVLIRTQNLRLRRYLSDHQGLYLAATILHGIVEDINFEAFFAGTLYYAIRTGV